MQLLPRVLLAVMAASFPLAALASEGGASTALDLTSHWAGFAALAVFFLAYGLVIAEETLHLRKSKPVMVAAGIIWTLVAIVYAQHGDTHTAEIAVRHNLLEFAELFLFLLAAMTYINAMDERGVFDLLRVKLVTQGFTLRTIFWITGALAFVISPVADNLTTALLMATVASAVGGSNKKFVSVACINIVIAANAGGAFSPFGDITTLMVWQKGLVDFSEFFRLFIPSVVNWLIPAAIMSLAIGNSSPDPVKEQAALQHGAWVIVGLFLGTIVMAVCAHNFLHLPPVMGMMTGLGVLKFYGYYLKRRKNFANLPSGENLGDTALAMETGVPISPAVRDAAVQYNIFKSLERAEWDTLMFFYGVILCVGGLGTMGYLSLGSQLMYGQLGPTTANILVGFMSAVVDNIPVMFAVLAMQPDMDLGQWLLVTLTAGVGGSLLSVGSAAGVAVMGQARGIYTFFSHLKWTWAIALGYAASIWTHFLVNANAFS
jgi:Na+/H+ antiporter NhaD/arsenite permease-like protein